MAVDVLEVQLHHERIGTITRLGGDRTVFAFDQEYVDNDDRKTLSLSFKDEYGGLISEFRPTNSRLIPFFSNLLPEGAMRDYLARKARVDPVREFFLLWALGEDLPGAVSVRSASGEELPPLDDSHLSREDDEDRAESLLRFSLAGIQLKFSALASADGGLTIPARGVGGEWIVKLPSVTFEGVPENEYAMMTLARTVGIEVPEIQLVKVEDIQGLPKEMSSLGGHAFAIKRFDRAEDAGAVHIEDFAQVFRVYPPDKYKKASYRNLAEVLWAEDGEESIAEFVRRLAFNGLIGNGDMHLKNWSLIYPDGRSPKLAPAYDFVSTIAYLPDDRMALSLARTKDFRDLTQDRFVRFAAKARLPEKLVLDTVQETVDRFLSAWSRSKGDLGLAKLQLRESTLILPRFQSLDRTVASVNRLDFLPAGPRACISCWNEGPAVSTFASTLTLGSIALGRLDPNLHVGNLDVAALSSLLLMLLLAGAPAQAVSLGGFTCITNNDAADCAIGEASLSADLTGQTLTIVMTGTDAGVVEEIRVEGAGITGMSFVSSLGVGNVIFTGSANGVLPGGNQPGVGFVEAASSTAGNPKPRKGIGYHPQDTTSGQGGSFLLAGDLTGLRVGVHVIGFESGGSESFVTGGPVIPEPNAALVFALGSGLVGTAVWRLRS